MSALSIQPTFPIFTDIDGQPLEAGYVWIGTANLDPQTNPINVYWDAALTILAPQPIRTLAGYPSNNGTPGRLYVNSDYSIRVMNRNGSVVYSASAATERYSGAVIQIDSTDVLFTPSWTGSVTRTSFAKMADWLSLADFIPVGTDTNVIDCAPFLQAAIDAGGGSVFIPEGRYRMATQIVLPVYGFYAQEPGHQIFSQGAELVVETTSPLFTQNVGTDYTSKWFFHDLSFSSSTANSKLFDMDRIYNSIFMNNVFTNIDSVFYSRVDRSGSPSFPQGYIQSAYITNNHFAVCGKGIDAKRAFNLDVSNNYFEACDTPIAVDGTGDPACNMIRITNNVLEGGAGTPIILGAVFGGLIQGNYFEANSGAATCEIKLDVIGAAFHRGLEISANQFQPTTGQKADSNWYNIRIANTIATGRGPVILGNVTSGPRLVTGVENTQILAAGNYEGSGNNIIDQFPIPGQTQVKFGGINTGLADNRATAYDGAGTWKVIKIDNVVVPTVYDFNGFLNLYNVGGTLLGATQVSFKVRTWIDGQGVITAALVGTLDLEEITGARNSGGDPLYAAYWGSVVPSFSVSGSSVTISFNTFNDYSTPGPGKVYSLGPSLSVVASDGKTAFTRVQISLP